MRYTKKVCTSRSLDIVANDYKQLLSMWRDLSPYVRQFRVRSVTVERPLTHSQLQRLPKRITDRLVFSTVDSIEFCEALYALKDSRD